MIDKDNHYIPAEPELAHVGGNTAGGNPQTFYPDLWRWMVDTLNIKTVFDVGCGEGHAIAEFERLGCNAAGFDGAIRNVQCASWSFLHDLTKGSVVIADKPELPLCDMCVPDLVWCCEVVGQIDIQYIDNVCRTISQGKYLALTHQLPDQQGYHVVNGRPPEFWTAVLRDYGMDKDDALTEESKRYAGFYWAKTGGIYRRRSLSV